ncbi:hypothetical protein CCH79_00000539 [Gambusia affinis]|uniref:MIR domain-containing protein n=1 Tax=Gambusia affinis TaxID=33528 RepID=A0A315VWL4_GAMAF|nr:hypothetical protein CCH79_00000539 [Gambusia affinis]
MAEGGEGEDEIQFLRTVSCTLRPRGHGAPVGSAHDVGDDPIRRCKGEIINLIALKIHNQGWLAEDQCVLSVICNEGQGGGCRRHQLNKRCPLKYIEKQVRQNSSNRFNFSQVHIGGSGGRVGEARVKFPPLHTSTQPSLTSSYQSPIHSNEAASYLSSCLADGHCCRKDRCAPASLDSLACNQNIIGINSPVSPWQDDEVVLQSVATIQKEHRKFCLAAEGLGNRLCYLEPTSEAKYVPPDMCICNFVLEQSLSVRALQEMLANTGASSEGAGQGGGHRTLLYGHAILLRHSFSDMYLTCLKTSRSLTDKLSFDVGLQEDSVGEACWWTIHPASKQRSEGEKVRIGDDLILHLSNCNGNIQVDASFMQTLWNVQPTCSSGSMAVGGSFILHQ